MESARCKQIRNKREPENKSFTVNDTCDDSPLMADTPCFLLYRRVHMRCAVRYATGRDMVAQRFYADSIFAETWCSMLQPEYMTLMIRRSAPKSAAAFCRTEPARHDSTAARMGKLVSAMHCAQAARVLGCSFYTQADPRQPLPAWSCSSPDGAQRRAHRILLFEKSAPV
jgi:hypothetical protein